MVIPDVMAIGRLFEDGPRFGKTLRYVPRLVAISRSINESFFFLVNEKPVRLDCSAGSHGHLLTVKLRCRIETNGFLIKLFFNAPFTAASR